MKQILLIILGLSTALLADFTRSGNVVTNNVTQLQWQDNEAVMGDSWKTWTEAIDYCEALSLDGHSDWRLPNKKELLSIVDYSRFDPAIKPVFTYTESYNYWSSTTDTRDTSYAWFVGFYSGATGHYDKPDTIYVRCVR